MATAEKVRLPPIPPELTSQSPSPTTKIKQMPDGTLTVHSVDNGTEGHIDYKSDGSFQYHSSTGSMVDFAANNSIHYAKGGHTHTVDNNHDEKHMGNHREGNDGDYHGETAKNYSSVHNGMGEHYGTGHAKIAAADIHHSTTTGSIVQNAARDVEVTAKKGRITHHSTGVQTHTTDQGDFHVASGGDVDLNSTANTLVTSQQNITTSSQQGTTVNSQQGVAVNAQQGITLSAQAQPVALNKQVTVNGASPMGAGTINVTTGVYLNGSAYTNPDYALEHYFLGQIVKFANNKGAAEYQGITSLDVLEDKLEKDLRLPGLIDRPTDIFERADFVLEKLEEAYLYIIELHKRIKTLEEKINND